MISTVNAYGHETKSIVPAPHVGQELTQRWSSLASYQTLLKVYLLYTASLFSKPLNLILREILYAADGDCIPGLITHRYQPLDQQYACTQATVERVSTHISTS